MAANSRAAALASLPLSRFCCALGAVTLAALEEGVGREPAAYLLPETTPSLALTRSLSLAAGVLAAAVAWRRHAGFSALSWGISVLASSLALTGAAWFLSFGQAHAAALALVLPLAIGVASGVILGAAARSLGAPARELAVLQYALEPLRALCALALLVGCAALAARLGSWRSAALLGACAAGLALYLPTLERNLYGRVSSRWSAVSGLVALALCVASTLLAHVALPSSALGRYPGEIVFTSHGPGQYVVSSVQQSFEVYRGNVLRLASVDAKRYAECLVQPALALAPRRGSVLVLGSADGLVEREVLAYPDVARLTTVADDLSLADLAKNNEFFRAASADALHSPRLTVVEAEALVWLTTHPARFDVIVVDLPDPSDYSQGKNYTHFFFEQLLTHLGPSGLFVTQATSNAASPKSFSSIAASVVSAGFRVQGYSAAIPTLGEWTFVLGSLGELPQTTSLSPLARRVLERTSYLTPRRLELLLSAPPARDLHAPVNTLSEQPVVELLNEERRTRGL
jgi:spermidine synthase